MDDDSLFTAESCGNGSRCEADGCPCSPATEVPLPDARRLVLGAIGLFVVPAVLAVVGAACSGTVGGAQLLGALVGLAIGMAGAVLVARRVRPSKKGCP